MATGRCSAVVALANEAWRIRTSSGFDTLGNAIDESRCTHVGWASCMEVANLARRASRQDSQTREGLKSILRSTRFDIRPAMFDARFLISIRPVFASDC